MPSTTCTDAWADLLSAVQTPDALSGRLGYDFRDLSLAQTAVTHRSWCAENGGVPSNERLEFLGDSVLGLVVTNYIYRRYDDLPEGKLAKVRATVVSSAALADLARELELGSILRLGKGELASGGADKSSILADAMEAVIGAVYLDGGWEAASSLIVELLADRIEASAHRPGRHDFKTRLQEYAARHHDALPTYRVQSDGPDHEKQFFAEVVLGDVVRGEGEGRSKKEAEQAAAADAWGRVADAPRPAADTVGERLHTGGPPEAGMEP